jgi:transposase, IS5 family
MDGLSDEAVVAKWVENPYWQYFCGYDYLEWKFSLDASSLVRWRKRLGEDGMEKILFCTLQTAVCKFIHNETDLRSRIGCSEDISTHSHIKFKSLQN